MVAHAAVRSTLWFALAAYAALAGAAPPNVVLIVSDDQHWGDYGFMGHATLRTPNLDRLARESLVFPRGYVPSSLCCPSLASLITGLRHWLEDHEYESVDQLRGSMSLLHCPDPTVFERANYLRMLQLWKV
jgi:hypothetical protein